MNRTFNLCMLSSFLAVFSKGTRCSNVPQEKAREVALEKLKTEAVELKPEPEPPVSWKRAKEK